MLRNAKNLVLAVLLALGATSAANAALSSRDWLTAGDGLLTFDDQSNREWLDLSQTRIGTYNSVVGRLAPGLIFAGFNVASFVDVGSLFYSGGWGSFPGAWGGSESEANYLAGRSIVSLLGGQVGASSYSITGTVRDAVNTIPDFNYNVFLHGIHDTSFGEQRFRSQAEALFSHQHVDSTSPGVFLYRDAAVAAPIPEPETYAMMLAGLGLLGVAARRRKAKLSKQGGNS